MDAKQLLQYKFWLACGAIILIELGIILLVEPTNENGQTAVEVKRKLDEDYKKLEGLYKRAGNGEPKGVFDVENPIDIEKLTKDYLLTPKWKDVLQPHADKYNEQLSAIKKDLVRRSKILHETLDEKIAARGDRYEWYTDYVNKTRNILTTMRNAGAIIIVDAEKKEDNDFESGKEIRSRVGFYTKDADIPETNEHPLLTTKFRIIEKISQVIINNGSSSIVNPIVKLGKDSDYIDKKCAAITGVSWRDNRKPEELLANEVGQLANAYEVTLSLLGSTSSLIAAEAAIEAIAEPIMVVVSSRLSARSAVKPGERKNVSDEPMTMEITLAIIDFSKLNTADSGNVSSEIKPETERSKP